MALEINKVDPILEKYGSQKSALIQILMDVQAVFKYLPREVLDYISDKLNVAMDILADAGMLDEDRIRLLLAVERNPDAGFNGDPEALARKLVRLSAELRRG